MRLRLLLFVLFLLSIWVRPAAAQTKILVGLSSVNIAFLPAYVAQEKGFFKDEGLEVLFVMFNAVYIVGWRLGLDYRDAVAVAFNSTGRDFEIAIAIAITAFSPAVAVATVVGPLIEVPIMLTLVWTAMTARCRFFGGLPVEPPGHKTMAAAEDAWPEP